MVCVMCAMDIKHTQFYFDTLGGDLWHLLSVTFIIVLVLGNQS